MLKTFITCFSLIGAFGATAAPAPFEIQHPDFRTFGFEEGTVPAEFVAGPGSKLSVVSDYFKEGSHALRWDWEKEDAELRFRSPEAFRHLTGENPDPIVYEWVTFCRLSSFSTWIFSGKPLGGALRFEVGGSRFYVNINFSGWGEAALQYGRDLAVFPAPGTSEMVIRPPRGVISGTLYFDSFAPRRELDVRAVRTTSRQPYVMNRELSSEEELYREADKLEAGFSVAILGADGERMNFPVPEKLSAEELEKIAKLRDVFLADFRPRNTFKESELSQLAALRERYALRRNGDFVSGRFPNLIRFYGDLELAGRALLYGKLPEKEREATRQLVYDMVDLVIQQGHGSFYGMRTSFIAPMLLLREELKQSGRYQPMLDRLRLITGVPELYLKNAWGNADFYNTLLSGCVGAIFLGDDPRVQHSELMVLRHWLDTSALNGEIMPDGTFTHHRMIYSGYGFPAITPIVKTVHLLRGTAYFPQQMYRTARRAILAMSSYANPYTPQMFSGRWRRCELFTPELAENLARIAECGDAPDLEAASRYLHFIGSAGKKSPAAERFRAAGVTPDPMNGTSALNYAVSLIHRKDGVMAVVRGQRDGLFANEAYADAGGNTMGRYLNYGQLQILGETPEKSGFVLDQGWNFNHWPGTTARVIDHDALRQHFENVEALTTESFAGGAALSGAGMWAMKLQEELPEVGDALRIGPPRYFLGDQEYGKRCRDSRYDPSFRARKSVFALDGVLVALGSGITASDGAPVATTLFQNSLAALPGDKFRSGEGFLLDSAGNGYVFPGGNVQLRRGEVANPYRPNWVPWKPEKHEALEPNAGVMELAYFDHGAAPRDAGYEYAILLRPAPGETEAFAAAWRGNPAELPLRVIRRDRAAHIVDAPRKKLTGYALFEAGTTGFGLVKMVSDPCVVMAEQFGDELRLAVFNPCFDDVSVAAMPKQRAVRTRIALDGDWELAEPQTRVRALGASEFEVTGSDLIPVEVKLRKRSAIQL